MNFTWKEKVVVSKVSSRALELTFKFKLGQIWRPQTFYHCWAGLLAFS